jgi:hypothetical protein
MTLLLVARVERSVLRRSARKLYKILESKSGSDGFLQMSIRRMFASLIEHNRAAAGNFARTTTKRRGMKQK